MPEINDWQEVPIDDWKEVPIGSPQRLERRQYSFGEALKSAPGGLLEGIKEYGKTFTSPETYKNILGLTASLTSPETEERLGTAKNLLSSLWQQGKESYGGWENIKRTIAEHPLQPIMDVSTGLTAGGTGIAKLFPQAAKAGETMATAGRAMEPLSIMGKPAQWTYQGIKKGITGPLGVSTGMGASTGAAGKMVEGSETFAKAMRGKIPGEEIVEKTRTGLRNVAEARGDRYRTSLTEIENLPNPPRFNISSVDREFDRQLRSYKISKTIDPQTGEEIIDFSRSALFVNKPAQNDFNNILKVINNAKTDASFYSTPVGYDHLKRQLAGMYKETSQGRAAVEATSDAVRTELKARVPGYAEMQADYSKTSKLIDEIERDLSVGDRKTTDTALRKLNAAMREDDEFRRSLIAEVEKASGENLQAMISGRLAQSWMPKSWMGREFAIGSLFSGVLGHPRMLAGLALASPRLMGETFRLLNLTEKGLKKIGIGRPEVRMGIMQAQKVPPGEEGSQNKIPDEHIGMVLQSRGFEPDAENIATFRKNNRIP